MKGLEDLMKQAQSMQDNMKKMQEDIANLEVEGESGAGMIKVTMTGRYDVTKVGLDDSVLKEDKEIIEDLLAAAVNDAVRKVELINKEKMGGLAQGFNLPDGFKMPF